MKVIRVILCGIIAAQVFTVLCLSLGFVVLFIDYKIDMHRPLIATALTPNKQFKINVPVTGECKEYIDFYRPAQSRISSDPSLDPTGANRPPSQGCAAWGDMENQRTYSNLITLYRQSVGKE